MAKSGKTPKVGSKRKTTKAPRPSPPVAKGKAKAAPPPAKAAPKALRPARPAFTKADLEHFRKKLLERRARLLRNVAAMEAEALKSGDKEFSVDHMADHGSDSYEQDFTLSLVESERRELYEIGQALERISLGEYGICEGTGLPIGRARLEAIPHTRHSIEYQRRIEAGEIEEEEEEEKKVAPARSKRRPKGSESEEEGEEDEDAEEEGAPPGLVDHDEEDEEDEKGATALGEDGKKFALDEDEDEGGDGKKRRRE
ncbi:MAG: TraR/DksA family transcriptional regulator [Planctomycetaceae bacterium]